ncbi:hypothetical protein [Persicobacter sp. CCB-QB2]|uniref:hypothetical protein n=1 Tax=Persicobacter sp. CCB-QB2 TaxID=1561025 RepID=UPI0006A98FBF|nr:hypothetical protein [Persicobacter sp. CCB-QB2]
MEIRQNRDWKNKVWTISQGKKSCLVFSLKELALFERLQQQGGFSADQCYLLVNEIGLLNIYFHEVPETSLDILEFTDRPVALRLNGGRNVPAGMMAEDDRLNAFFMKAEHFGALARVQHPLVLVELKGGISGQAWLQAEQNLLILQDDSLRFPFKRREVAMGTNGDIKIKDL